jgi:hypothetical protein
MRTAPGVIDALGRRALAGQLRTFGPGAKIVDLLPVKAVLANSL